MGLTLSMCLHPIEITWLCALVDVNQNYSGTTNRDSVLQDQEMGVNGSLRVLTVPVNSSLLCTPWWCNRFPVTKSSLLVHPAISGLSAPALLFQSWTVCWFVCFSKTAFPELTELLDCFENAPTSFGAQLWAWALNFGYWIPELLTWQKIIGLRFFPRNNWREPLPVSE